MEFQKQIIFTARTGGYHVYRIPSISVTRRGTLVLTGEARRGRGGDYDVNDIVIRRSSDDGANWTPMKPLVCGADFGPGTAGNFTPIADRFSNRLHALFCHNYNRAFHLFSDDEGASWSEPREITPVLEAFRSEYSWVVAATGPGHGLQLRNGRLVVPVWFSDGSAHDMGPAHRGHRPSCVGVIYSDDRGMTWQRGELAARTGGMLRNPNETTLVELADGSVLFNIRSESDARRRLISVSPDGAGNWTSPRFDSALLDPVCMGSLLRVSWPESGANRIVFANPDTLDRTMESCWGGRIQAPNCDRKQLTIQLSLDDCRSWVCKRIIEPGPAGYSDLALDRQGRILCFYECGILSGMFDDRYLALARFDLEWLTASAAERKFA